MEHPIGAVLRIDYRDLSWQPFAVPRARPRHHPLSCQRASMGPGCAILRLQNGYREVLVRRRYGKGNAFDPYVYGGPRSNMPYTYQGWTLYSREVKLKKGPKVTIYFFSKRKPKSGKPMDEMPKNRKVGVNKRTGLPFLRKG